MGNNLSKNNQNGSKAVTTFNMVNNCSNNYRKWVKIGQMAHNWFKWDIYVI